MYIATSTIPANQLKDFFSYLARGLQAIAICIRLLQLLLAIRFRKMTSDWTRLLAGVTNNAHYHVSTPALELSGLLVVQMRACIGGDGAT